MHRLLLLSALFWLGKLGAQTAQINGQLSDSAGRGDFYRASVLLLTADSNKLIHFTRANKKGEFRFDKLNAGTYKIIASSPGWADITDYVVVTVGESKNIGQLAMYDEVVVMEAIIIRRRAAIEMRGDTMIYAADSFKTFEGATVEDLLRKLPGVQVDRSGKITAQGKTVDRVLVDGEEFFGNDATVATRNLNAQNVDAVKVYDAQTDDAKAAGDGDKLKIMDIRLKDNAKQGWVGKLSAGGAIAKDRNLYDGKAFINHFNKKERFGMYGLAANSPEVNISWRDRREFTNSINSSFDDNGFMFTSFTGSEFDYWLGYSQGLPTGNQANGYYQNKWNNDKVSLSVNMGYRDLLLNTATTNRSSNILNNNLLLQNNANTVANDKSKVDMGISTDIALDTFTNLGIGINAEQNTLNNEQQQINESQREGQIVNTQSTLSNVLGNNQALELKTYLKRKFADRRKYLNIQLNVGTKQNEDSTYFESTVNTFTGGTGNAQNWKQYKQFTGTMNTLAGSINFRLPLNKKWVLNLQNISNIENQNSEKYTRNATETNYIDSLSSISNYNNIRFTNTITALYTLGKWEFGAGLGHNIINLQQTEKIRSINFKQGPINTLTPVLNMRYKYASQGSFNASYQANTNLPSLSQIQPIIDNINPINLSIGNPNLKNSLTHNLNMTMHDGKTFTSRWLWLNVNAYYTQDALVNSVIYDEFGRSVRQTVNRDGVYGFNANSNWYKSFSKLPLSISMGYNPSYQHYTSLVNNQENRTNNWSHRLNPSIDLDFEKYGLSLEYEVNFNRSISSLNTSFNNNNITQNWNLELFYENPKILDFTIEIDQNIRPTTSVFTSNSNNLIISGNISRAIDKKRTLELELGVYDALNQNLGYYRNVYENTVFETNYNTFTQFWYGRLTYKFNKLKGNNQSKPAHK